MIWRTVEHRFPSGQSLPAVRQVDQQCVFGPPSSGSLHGIVQVPTKVLARSISGSTQYGFKVCLRSEEDKKQQI